MPSTPTYDVCVVGSGAAGGMVTKALCEAGAKVILLEAGKEVKPTEYLSHCWPYELQFRGLRGEKQEPFYPPDIKNTIRYENSDAVGVDRIRVLGGRTLHWNAVVLRYSAADFRERSLQGIEEDWPISYEELAPYYEHVEQMIGVCGNDDGLEMLPAGKHYLPPLPFRCSEHMLKRACASIGVPVIAMRKALLTRALRQAPGVPLLRPLHGRLRCLRDLLHYRQHASQSARHRQSHPAAECPGARNSGRQRRPGARRFHRRSRHQTGRRDQGARHRAVLRDHRKRAATAQFDAPASIPAAWRIRAASSAVTCMDTWAAACTSSLTTWSA